LVVQEAAWRLVVQPKVVVMHVRPLRMQLAGCLGRSQLEQQLVVHFSVSDSQNNAMQQNRLPQSQRQR
jgi:hypothetical protein